MSARNIYRSGATIACLLLLLMLATASPMRAQRFEHIFGDTCHEYGFSGIHTPDGGYISVGSAMSPSGSCSSTSKHDIYVVKLNSNGTLAWSKTYDINGGNDIGRDIIRSNSSYGGYLITGWTDNSGCRDLGGVDMFLMRIDTLGVPQWTNVYGTSSQDEFAYRLIECTYDTHRRQSTGEIVVVGQRINATTPLGMDAVMLRTSATGTILDFKTYGGTRLDAFYGVTESRIGTDAGDIIAAGYSNSFTNDSAIRGFAVRVGPDGTFVGGSPRGSSVYGRDHEATRFAQVEELTVGREAGRLVFCGDSRIDTILNFDPYVLKTRSDPCSPMADVCYGDSAGSYEETWDIQEIKSPAGGGLNNGNLVVSGLTEVLGNGKTRTFLFELNPGLVLQSPLSGLGFKLYGDTANKGYSVDPVLALTGKSTPGFYLTSTTMNYPGSPAGTGLQMYVIKTNNYGVSYCHDHTYLPTRTVPNLPVNCPSIDTAEIGTSCQVSLTYRSQTWADTLCNDSLAGPPNPKPGIGLIDPSRNGVDNVLLRDDGVEAYPNPVKAGSLLTLSGVAEQGGRVAIVVSDLRGGVILRQQVDLPSGQTALTLHTDGWAKGVYLITTQCGGVSRNKRVIVSEE